MSNLIKTPKQIEKIRVSGKILAEVLRLLSLEVKAGVSTIYLDELARELIEERGGEPAFLGYHPDGAAYPFPYTLCTSINNVIVHGRPSDRKLKEGDILKLDLGVDWNGGITDAAITVPVGRISENAKRLLKLTKLSLDMGIKKAIAGNTLGDIGHAIETVIVDGGANVIDGLTGHGVGIELHEDPVVFNFGEPGEGIKLKEGMVLALEPMTSFSTDEITQLADDSFATKDGSISAHFEHTILIKKTSAEILTRLPSS